MDDRGIPKFGLTFRLDIVQVHVNNTEFDKKKYFLLTPNVLFITIYSIGKTPGFNYMATFTMCARLTW